MRNNTEEVENILFGLFLNTTNDTDSETFLNSHRLLDGVTYTFCVVGILLNFFAFGILLRKATMGVLLIKLILISDGLVCIFYLLNQIWTDITLTYLLTALVTEYLSRKSFLTYVSNIFRILAVATVSVSNWYIVIMIIHRCISIYVTPLRSRLGRSLWVFVQKQVNLWIAYGLCWLFSLLITSFPLREHQILLEVLIFVLPLTLVFIFSVSLLVKLRMIQRNAGPASKVSPCCFHQHTAIKCSQKIESDYTFAQTKHGTASIDRLSVVSEEHQKKLLPKTPNEPITVNRSNESERKKTYYRITTTILSLSASFLILDSLQLLDLLIRIPWRNILGSIEEAHVNASIAPTNTTNMEEFLTEVQRSGEKQSVLSIVKNTCTLGKTLANFLILCAHSRHFRALVSIKFKRGRRLLRLMRRRMHPRLSRHANADVGARNFRRLPSAERNAIGPIGPELKAFDIPGPNTSDCIEKSKHRLQKNTPNRRKREAGHSTSSRSSLIQSLFRQKRRDDEGFVVHKLHRPLRKGDIAKYYQQIKIGEGGRPVMGKDMNVRLFNYGGYQFKHIPNEPFKFTEHSISNDCSSSMVKCQFSSSTYQPTSNSVAECEEGSESAKSCCTTCDCKVVGPASTSSSSCASNYTYPGAFRAHCCDCHRVRITQMNSKLN
ncbi:hypothetical protein TcWFU_004888 [Taenia crassiceps]|uniref:G-protein coupled receptors family 1 profile domain-containing protein n=1 Tax=Taenia crassiceps TaxID=6207 RepID=A0ABR4QDL4_9CEST